MSSQVAEQRLREQNCSFKWDDIGGLSFWSVSPAFKTHYKTKERVWFNQVHSMHASYLRESFQFRGQLLPDLMYPYHTCYGDGSEIKIGDIQHIRAVSWQSAVGFRWRNGDLLAVDNMAVQHGRMSFTGPRKLLTYFTSNCKFLISCVNFTSVSLSVCLSIYLSYSILFCFIHSSINQSIHLPTDLCIDSFIYLSVDAPFS